jgi:hypothetical protein
MATPAAEVKPDQRLSYLLDLAELEPPWDLPSQPAGGSQDVDQVLPAPCPIEESLRMLRERALDMGDERPLGGREVQNRGELMKRLKIRDPSEDFIEGILEEYLGPRSEGEGQDELGEEPQAPSPLNREELMGRLKIKDPSEEFVEGILEEFRAPGREVVTTETEKLAEVEKKRQEAEAALRRCGSDVADGLRNPLQVFIAFLEDFDTSNLTPEQIIKFNAIMEASRVAEENIMRLTGPWQPVEDGKVMAEAMLERFKGNLRDMFGEKMAQRMYERQLRDHKPGNEYLSAAEVERFLGSFKHILENFLGPENAAEAINQLKNELVPKAAKGKANIGGTTGG